jgi:hypothetical protein
MPTITIIVFEVHLSLLTQYESAQYLVFPTLGCGGACGGLETGSKNASPHLER